MDTSKLTGNWVVTYYWDDDKEETYKFTGNSFSFLANGTVSVTVSNSTFPGVWSSGIDDSKAKLYLIFASPEHLEEISDDWHVVEQTDTKIRLADESGGDGSTDYLTFERQ
ncbi:MAG: hypothetical protein A2X64_04325 [Ignavibacteria bacterium GWF2_33_9]|nr:MAG: hypothetical protein A2X64_04325 [Ignavibacteria bacterium GWF2_33_9]